MILEWDRWHIWSITQHKTKDAYNYEIPTSANVQTRRHCCSRSKRRPIQQIHQRPRKTPSRKTDQGHYGFRNQSVILFIS